MFYYLKAEYCDSKKELQHLQFKQSLVLLPTRVSSYIQPHQMVSIKQLCNTPSLLESILQSVNGYSAVWLYPEMCAVCVIDTMVKKFCGKLIVYIPLIKHEPHGKRCVQQLFSFCMCIRCRGNVFTEPLPSNDRGYTCRHTDWWEVFMKYAVEIDSGAMIYIPSFINIDSVFRKLIGGYTDSMVIS
jgi:hypothetical protein